MSSERAMGRPTMVMGGTGQVGFELVRQLSRHATVIAPSRSELDLSNARQIREVIRAINPSVILNTAAYTAVDRAESDRAAARSINADAPGIIAEEAKAINAAVVHYSTDYVFDGAKKIAYVEHDSPNPLNVYGETKLAGEQGVAASGAAAIILRTSWVYGTRGHNFLSTMLRLGAEKPELRIVNDQVGAPTLASELASATLQVLSAARGAPEGVEEFFGSRAGVYHLAAAGSTSWFGFATAIFSRTRLGPRLVPVPTSQYPTPARRPLFSVLDCSRAMQTFGLQLPAWEVQLDSAMRSLP